MYICRARGRGGGVLLVIRFSFEVIKLNAESAGDLHSSPDSTELKFVRV